MWPAVRKETKTKEEFTFDEKVRRRRVIVIVVS